MQLSLFDQPKRRPRGPVETKRSAKESIRPNAETLRAKVLEYLERQGERGATDNEIQEALRMAGNTQRPRRKELLERGLIRDSGKTRPTATGRQAVVWVANNSKKSDKGLE